MDELFSDNEYKGLFGSVTDEVDLQIIVVELSVVNEGGTGNEDGTSWAHAFATFQ